MTITEREAVYEKLSFVPEPLMMRIEQCGEGMEIAIARLLVGTEWIDDCGNRWKVIAHRRGAVAMQTGENPYSIWVNVSSLLTARWSRLPCTI